MSNKTKIFHLTVDSGSAGRRLDKFLATQEFIPSRSRAAELIDRGLVTMRGAPLKASYPVQPGNLIQIEIPAASPSRLVPLDAPLDRLYEDSDILVLNKPSGLVVHPAAGHAQDTLVNILLHHVNSLALGFGENRPGIVHRLDRDTSGILVVAKNDRAHHALAKQFREKTAHRIYWALAAGIPRQREGTFRSHLARHPNDRKRFASQKSDKGKYAVTHFKVLQTVPRFSWLQCKLETGRTHQIRVHLSEAGHPILGDPIYGGRLAAKQLARLALHACELGFEHPRTFERLLFRVPWPDGLRDSARGLGFANV